MVGLIAARRGAVRHRPAVDLAGHRPRADAACGPARSPPRPCAAFILLPVLAKWLLIGRWKPQEIRLWSLGYLRLWVVKTLIRTNPMVMFAGSPLYLWYLRALGAKIGKGVTIFSTHRAGLHRHAPDRVAHRDPQRRVVQRLPRRRRRDPHRRDHDRRERGRRRGWHSGDRHRGGRRRPARACLVAAPRAVDPGGRELARLARAAHRHRLQWRRPGPLRRRPAVPLQPRAAVQPAGARARGRDGRCSGCCRRSPTSPTSSGPARSRRCAAASTSSSSRSPRSCCSAADPRACSTSPRCRG